MQRSASVNHSTVFLEGGLRKLGEFRCVPVCVRVSLFGYELNIGRQTQVHRASLSLSLFFFFFFFFGLLCHRKNWKFRHFRLFRDEMQYYRKERHSHPAGIIDLRGSAVSMVRACVCVSALSKEVDSWHCCEVVLILTILCLSSWYCVCVRRKLLRASWSCVFDHQRRNACFVFVEAKRCACMRVCMRMPPPPPPPPSSSSSPSPSSSLPHSLYLHAGLLTGHAHLHLLFPQDLNKWFEAVSERIEAIKRTAHSSIRALLFTFTCLPVHNSNPLSTSCTKVTFCPSCFGVCMCSSAITTDA